MSEKDLQKFGAGIRAEREYLGISQEELAARAGLHRTYLGSVERGERNLGLLNVVRIARALGVHAATLLETIPMRGRLSNDEQPAKRAAGTTQRR